jgi:adenylate cyclase
MTDSTDPGEAPDPTDIPTGPIRHDRLEDARFAVATWIVEAGLRDLGPEALVTGTARRMREEGLPLDRFQVAFRLLHPLFDGMSLTWTERDGLQTSYNTGRRRPTPVFLQSPYYYMLSNGLSELRVRLDGNEPQPFPIFEELRQDGLRDYLALATGFGHQNGSPNLDQAHAPTIGFDSDGVLSSFATRKERLAPEEEYAFRWLMRPLALALRVSINGHIARTALETYHGSLVGERILGGTILRGSGERLSTAIWYCDMRNSTGLADNLPLDRFLQVLDTYFECTAGAVKDMGGQVLDILGDAVLGIFPVLGEVAPQSACRQALDAAEEAQARLKRLAASGRPGADRIAFGIGLHYGDVIFGNVGTPDRLKFTLVGRAVIEAARTAELTKAMRRPILVTDAMARQLGGHGLEDIGVHQLRGLPVGHRLYAAGPAASAAVG